MAALLDSLGVMSAHIVGHSQGASVALNFAVAFPARVKTLTLYGSSIFRNSPVTGKALMIMLRQADESWLIARYAFSCDTKC